MTVALPALPRPAQEPQHIAASPDVVLERLHGTGPRPHRAVPHPAHPLVAAQQDPRHSLVHPRALLQSRRLSPPAIHSCRTHYSQCPVVSI